MGWVEDAVQGYGSPQGSGSGNMGMIIPAAIGGAAQLGGAALGGKAASRAAKAQAASQDKALAFAREQEQAAQGRYGQSKAQYDRQVADWYAARNALLGRYGVDINLGSGGLPPGGAPAAPPPGAVPRSAAPVATVNPYQGATLGQIVQSKAPEEWADWSNYGLGPRSA